MNDITAMIERESDLKAQLKELRKELNECIEATSVYKAYSDQLMQDDQFSKKVVKAHSLKLAYEIFKPKDEDDT
jgi:hypothetical protein